MYARSAAFRRKAGSEPLWRSTASTSPSRQEFRRAAPRFSRTDNPTTLPATPPARGWGPAQPLPASVIRLKHSPAHVENSGHPSHAVLAGPCRWPTSPASSTATSPDRSSRPTTISSFAIRSWRRCSTRRSSGSASSRSNRMPIHGRRSPRARKYAGATAMGLSAGGVDRGQVAGEPASSGRVPRHGPCGGGGARAADLR